jgi:hypothetical protein
MAHYVICSVCGQRFDRDKIQAVKSGARRYAHYSCKPDGEIVPLPQVDSEYADLMECIKEIYKDEINYALVKKQIKQYQEEYNYTLSGIKKSLIYFYKVKGNPIDKSKGGIGIVPFVYKDAYNYYYSLFVAQSQNENKNLQQITSKIKEIIIKPPKIKKKIRLFNLGEEEDEEVSDE